MLGFRESPSRRLSFILLILGIRYYLPGSTLQTPFRPFLTMGIGSNIGVEAKNEVGFQVVQKSRIMTSFGSHVGGGWTFGWADP